MAHAQERFHWRRAVYMEAVAQAESIREQLRNADLPNANGQLAYKKTLIAERAALKAYKLAVEELAVFTRPANVP
jgi:hypothetical protein